MNEKLETDHSDHWPGSPTTFVTRTRTGPSPQGDEIGWLTIIYKVDKKGFVSY